MPKRAEVILYAEDGWDKGKIISIIELKQSIKEYAFILHDSDLDDNNEIKKPYFHIYLGFGSTNVQFEHIAAWFHTKTELVQKIKTNKYLLLKYYLHCNQPEKSQYDIEQFTSSFDIQQFFESKEQKRDLEEILEKCAEGIITRQNYEHFIDPIIYSKNQPKIMHAWEYADHIEAIAQQNNRNLAVIYVTGESGSGKTLLCKLYAQQMGKSAYISASGKDPFSNYNGEEIVILDDFRPEESLEYAELLKLLDPYHASPIKSRYHNKIPKFSICFITTVLPIDCFLRAYSLSSIDNELQFYRRVQEVWTVSKTEIYIQKFDKDTKKYTPVKTMVSPIPSWLQSHIKEVTEDTPQSVLESICNQYRSSKGENL